VFWEAAFFSANFLNVQVANSDNLIMCKFFCRVEVELRFVCYIIILTIAFIVEISGDKEKD